LVVSEHRRPPIRFSDAPRGTCRWCGEIILYDSGPKRGSIDRRRRWHPACVELYLSTDPRELRRRIRRRDRGICATCQLDTYELRRKVKGRGMRARLRKRGFDSRRSLWELDHVVPLIDGGGHDASNLQTLCVPCHRAKSGDEQRERAGRSREPERETPPASPRPIGGKDRPSRKSRRLAVGIDELLARADELNARVEGVLRVASRKRR
jgi:5-methylcytosine-specific restriction endonuclease McrA